MKLSILTLAVTGIAALGGQAALAGRVTMIPLSTVQEKITKEECLKRYQQEIARLAEEYMYKFVLGKEEYAGMPGSPIMKRAVNFANVDLVNRKTGASAPLKVGEVKYNALVYQGDEPYCSIHIATPPITQE